MAGWQTRFFFGVVREKECGVWRIAKPLLLFTKSKENKTCLEYPTMPLAGSSKVLRAPARWVGIQRAPKPKSTT